MKFARIVVMLAITAVVPGFLVRAVAQQEVDPAHFDQTEPTKTAKSPTQPQGPPKTAALKRQKKLGGKVPDGARTLARQDHPKPENQRMAATHSTGE